ncbi:MAG: hypothetical protein ABSC06_12485 [Rhodopila sp.]
MCEQIAPARRLGPIGLAVAHFIDRTQGPAATGIPGSRDLSRTEQTGLDAERTLLPPARTLIVNQGSNTKTGVTFGSTLKR